MTQIINIDVVCANYGYMVGSEKEIDVNVIGKALGVLTEQGVYALFLYLLGKEKNKEFAEIIWKLLKDNRVKIVDTDWNENEWHEKLKKKVLVDLDKLILARKIIEQTLTYARYHAKARGEK